MTLKSSVPNVLVKRSGFFQSKGIAAIEATFALPVLFLLFYGIVEFGQKIIVYNILDRQQRVAVRYLADRAGPGIDAALLNQTRSLVVYGTLAPGGTALLDGLILGDVAIDSTIPNQVTVTTSYTYSSVFSGIPAFFGSGIDTDGTLTSSVQMTVL